MDVSAKTALAKAIVFLSSKGGLIVANLFFSLRANDSVNPGMSLPYFVLLRSVFIRISLVKTGHTLRSVRVFFSLLDRKVWLFFVGRGEGLKVVI
jgi:hypothetical protein